MNHSAAISFPAYRPHTALQSGPHSIRARDSNTTNHKSNSGPFSIRGESIIRIHTHQPVSETPKWKNPSEKTSLPQSRNTKAARTITENTNVHQRNPAPGIRRRNGKPPPHPRTHPRR